MDVADLAKIAEVTEYARAGCGTGLEAEVERAGAATMKPRLAEAAARRLAERRSDQSGPLATAQKGAVARAACRGHRGGLETGGYRRGHPRAAAALAGGAQAHRSVQPHGGGECAVQGLGAGSDLKSRSSRRRHEEG